MSVYLRCADGTRVLLDTAKCKLVFEESEYDLTGATLDFYDAEIHVLEGTMGTGRTPCRVTRVTDPFTGLKVETPMPLVSARAVASQLAKKPPRRRLRQR